MRHLLVLMLLASSAFGQRVAVIGDTTTTGGAYEGPWAPGNNALMLSGMLTHTASAGQEVDSAYWYGWSSGTATIDVSIYEIDGVDTTEVGTGTITVNGTDTLEYGVDFSPNISLSAGVEYAVAFGDTANVTAGLGSYYIGGATANCLNDSLMSTWTGGTKNYTYSYRAYATVVSGSSPASAIEIKGVTISGQTID